MPPGAVSLDDVDLDQVSVDYVLNCAKKGDMLELSEAIRAYHDSTLIPNMSNTGSTYKFFMLTTPDTAGPPPKRAPPPIPSVMPSPIIGDLSKSVSLSSTQVQKLTVNDIEEFDDDDDMEEVDSFRAARRNSKDALDLVLNLPSFSTGISDDDLRESAYEVLLACAAASGGLIVPSKDKKKDKRSKLMRKLGRCSKSDNVATLSQCAPRLVGLLETMRFQMEISEAMDIRTRQGLLNALLNMLEEGLINHPAVGFGESGRKASKLQILLAKIKESESLPSSTGELQRTECLRYLREIATPLAERPAWGDLTGEVCHWADGYHLNVRLYEKLLLCVFDILDEGKLTEEVEQILELLKSTWHVLGITETIHHTCYAWILFRQFVATSEQGILRHAIEQLNKIPLNEQRGPQERLHLKNLHCKVKVGDEIQDLIFLQSFLLPIQKWADKQLSDYHLQFAEGSILMEDMVTASMVIRRLLLEEPELAMQSLCVTDSEQIESFISSSIRSAFARTLQAVERTSNRVHEHPLGLLAEDTKKLLRRDATIFMPIFSKRHPQAVVVSASLLHKLYGNKLKPFLDGAEYLTEYIVSVFPAADSFEKYVISLITSVCEEETARAYCRKLNQYQIDTTTATLVMHWLNSQLRRITGWVERAVQQECWAPISPPQRHGNSIVEVYRIVEETVEQFYALKVPMRSDELNSLFRGIDNAFQVYANLVTDMLANIEDLVPPVPILTRYKRESGIKAFVKKEHPRVPDERKSTEINVVTTTNLCVQLNTLHYAISQLNKLEDSIWERWKRKVPYENFINEKSSSTRKDAFDGSRRDINAAIDRICELTGTKIVFWDLRDPFINNLYKPSISHARLEALIEPLDLALNQLCDIIVEPLRDRLVTSLLQASLDGLSRVILDGGPSRVFCTNDAKLLEEDLEVLKEFFISGGEGLPRGVVENQVVRVRHVIKLMGYETRELIQDLKSASELEMQGSKSKLSADITTLLRILCHRSDSEASQFLKKHFKIPSSAG
ncbi:hypothetical protein RJ641_036890 [Dillenia turbinata]|uniref:Protein unc-13 homolog n=1 Tax=Dillenia turbinata TaxID=194707 RepID=A0AAN8VQ45_9MAGN